MPVEDGLTDVPDTTDELPGNEEGIDGGETTGQTGESPPAEDTGESMPAEDVGEDTGESMPAEDVGEDTGESPSAEDTGGDTGESPPAEDTGGDDGQTGDMPPVVTDIPVEDGNE